MELREILLILISSGLGLVCIQRIRLLDRYEKEPFAKLAWVTFLGGGCAMAVALGGFELIGRLGFQDFESYVGTMLVIGPVEEMAKLIGLLSVLGIIRNELNEPADGMVYMACIALGFSLIENILYAAHPSGTYLLFVRLLTATPLHICFSALMGLTFYLAFKNRQAFRLLPIGYLLASLSHGFYDLVVFNHYSVILLGTTVLLIYGLTRNLFIYTLAVSPHRISLAQTIAATEGLDKEDGPACVHCGGMDAQSAYPFHRFTLWQCRRCDRFTVALDGLFRLFYHFAGIPKSVAGKHLVADCEKQGYMTLYRANHIHPESKLAGFNLRALDVELERRNYALKLKMKSKWYLPDNLFRLDQPGVTVDHAKMIRDAKAAFWHRWLFTFYKRFKP